LMPRVSVPSLLSSPVMLHPKKRTSLCTPPRCCANRRGVVEGSGRTRGGWRVPTRTGVGEYLRESGREAIEESAEASEVPVPQLPINPVPMKNTYRP
jgi:hypothetical protein